MQNFNNELVKALEDIKIRRDEISAEISKQQEEKAVLEQQIAILNDKLTVLNSNLMINNRIYYRKYGSEEWLR